MRASILPSQRLIRKPTPSNPLPVLITLVSALAARSRLCPICAPRLTITASDHVTELNNQRPKQPFFFLKPPSSIVLPGTGAVVRPKGVDLHYEVELALIIGRQVKDLSPEDGNGALDAIRSESNITRRVGVGGRLRPCSLNMSHDHKATP